MTWLALHPDGRFAHHHEPQHVHWWGDDPDGFIAGYYISFDNRRWSFTTRNDRVFALTLSGSDTTYSFWVRAVDDQGNGVWDALANSAPSPLWTVKRQRALRRGRAIHGSRRGGSHAGGHPLPDSQLPLRCAIRAGLGRTRQHLHRGHLRTGRAADLDAMKPFAKYLYALNDTTNPGAWSACRARPPS
jgi:hypothetical protein